MNIIGQKKLLKTIDDLLAKDKFPRFSILVGPAGSEKEKVANYVAQGLKAQQAYIGTKVESIREMVDVSYKAVVPTLFVIADADNMSQAAKNAMLKVTEEPQTNAYFLMTVTSINTVLATIRSRGQIFYCDPYEPKQLIDYAKSIQDLSEVDIHAISNVCQTPGDVDSLMRMGITDFYSFVEKVVDNIDIVSGTNAFKIGQSLATKSTDTDKVDMKLFFRAVQSVCTDRLTTNPSKYVDGIMVTSNYLKQLQNPSFNKTYIFDNWVLDIRKKWGDLE